MNAFRKLTRAVVALFAVAGAVGLLAAATPSQLTPVMQASPALSPGQAAHLAELAVQMPPAGQPENDEVIAVPPNAFNPDAGLGLVRGPAFCKSGHSAVNIENESATPVYVCWRRGTTKANYTRVCRKRCNGCAGGISRPVEIFDSHNQLYVIAGVATDAGVIVSVECAR